MLNYFTNIGIFLVRTIFDIYIIILLLRLLLQYVRADYFNPISQFIIKITQPIIKPLQKIISSFKGIDFAIVVLLLVLELLKLFLVFFIQMKALPNVFGLSIWAVGSLFEKLITIYFYGILLRVILSWVNPSSYNSFTVLLMQVTEPLLAPARHIIPPIGGLDFSPIVVLIILKLTSVIITMPLIQLGMHIAIGAT